MQTQQQLKLSDFATKLELTNQGTLKDDQVKKSIHALTILEAVEDEIHARREFGEDRPIFISPEIILEAKTNEDIQTLLKRKSQIEEALGFYRS